MILLNASAQVAEGLRFSIIRCIGTGVRVDVKVLATDGLMIEICYAWELGKI